MSNEVWDYKGWFWDDVNKRMYRWYELELLMKERELKKQQDKKTTKTSISASREGGGGGSQRGNAGAAGPVKAIHYPPPGRRGACKSILLDSFGQSGLAVSTADQAPNGPT